MPVSSDDHSNIPCPVTIHIIVLIFHLLMLTTSFVPLDLVQPYSDQHFQKQLHYANEVHDVLRKHFGASIPHPITVARNVSFILQNGHPIVTNPRPYYPNVAEIACIHCRPAAKLSHELEEFVESAPAGVIYFSMGSSVKPKNMPQHFRNLLVKVFKRLPQYHILWKWDENVTVVVASSGKTLTTANTASTQHFLTDLPKNVYLSNWLPQQDILGQRKLKAFITHGGLLSMYEAIYHGVPMVMLPVFCDHDVNAAKAEKNGYAVHIPLETITAEKLYQAILTVIVNVKYKRKISENRQLMLDQMNSPLETAIYWTEYVLRHSDTKHLQSPVRHMSFFAYHSLDVILFLMLGGFGIFLILKKILNYVLLFLHTPPVKPKAKVLKLT